MSTTGSNAVKNVLHEIASQAYGLAMGLQNVAPAQETPVKSVQYLLEISLHIEKTSKAIEDLILTDK